MDDKKKKKIINTIMPVSLCLNLLNIKHKILLNYIHKYGISVLCGCVRVGSVCLKARRAHFIFVINFNVNDAPRDEYYIIIFEVSSIYTHLSI